MDTISTAVVTCYGAFIGAIIAGVINGYWIVLPSLGGLLALLSIYIRATPGDTR